MTPPKCLGHSANLSTDFNFIVFVFSFFEQVIPMRMSFLQAARTSKSVTKKASKLNRKTTRRKLLGAMEQLEPRLNMAAYINEVHFDPLFGDNNKDQYFELRSDRTQGSLPQGTYLVVIEGSSGSSLGEIQSIFDLSNQSFGSNGYLVVAQGGNPYAINPNARALVGTTGFRGLPGDIYTTNTTLNNGFDFFSWSNTYLLIQTNTPPVLNEDIDAGNDGVPDGSYNSWTIMDGVSASHFIDGDSSWGYAPIHFREDMKGGSKVAKTIVEAEQMSYHARIGDSEGYLASDWVAGNTVSGDGMPEYRLQHGTFGTPRPIVLAGRALNHVGSSNFTGRVSGQVFQDVNADGIRQPSEEAIANQPVFFDTNADGISNSREYRLEPDDFIAGFEFTNTSPGVTLTVARDDNTQIGFKVRSQEVAFNSAQHVFAVEGVDFFPSTSRLRMDFYLPASSITLTFRGQSSVAEYGTMEGFRADGTSLGKVRTTALFLGQEQDLTLSTVEGMAYAVAYCDETYLSGDPFAEIDNLRYTIPEVSTTTDANGKYSVGYLTPGDYDVHVAAPAGLIQQYPAAPGFHSLNVTSAQSKTNADFSFLPNQPPVFNNQSFSLIENQLNGASIGVVNATELDLGQTVSLQIVGGNADAAFRLNGSTLVLNNTNLVNFEKKTQHVLTVRATDDYDPPASKDAFITINIQDTNDAPVIAVSNAFLDENVAVGATVVSPTATDEDFHADPSIKWQIASGNNTNVFAIDAATGKVTVKSGLDYESASSYVIVLAATDKGSPQATGRATFTVTVRDINEAPSVSTSTLSVDENSPTGTQLAEIAVTDPDSSQTHTLRIVGGTAASKLEFIGDSKQLSVKNGANFDFEQQSQFTIVVEAIDSGAPSMSAIKTLTLTVADRNDNPVVQPTSKTIPENSLSTLLIGTITGSDQDAGQKLTYKLDPGLDADLFKIDSTTGELRPIEGAVLDFENRNSYTVKVIATDDAVSPASGSAVITISLSDENDAPTLDDVSFSIDENSLADVNVGTILGKDQDSAESFTYTLSDNAEFQIDGASGKVTIKTGAVLNFEAKSTYTLDISVADHANAVAQAKLTVSLTDVNEAPTLVGSIPKQKIAPGQNWSFTVPSNVFVDQDALDQLSYSAADKDGFSLPSWLTFDRPTRTFSGAPSASELGLTTVRVRASDRASLTTSTTFDIEVANAWHNATKPVDVDGSGRVSALDSLLVINYVNLGLPKDAPKQGLPARNFLDVNDDGTIAPLDALIVINYVNLNGAGEGEGEGWGEPSNSQSASNLAFDAAISSIVSELERLKKRA